MIQKPGPLEKNKKAKDDTRGEKAVANPEQTGGTLAGLKETTERLRSVKAELAERINTTVTTAAAGLEEVTAQVEATDRKLTALGAVGVATTPSWSTPSIEPDGPPRSAYSPEIVAQDGVIAMTVAPGQHITVNGERVLTESEVERMITGAVTSALAEIAKALQAR